MHSTILRVENLTIGYGNRTLVRDISFELAPGECVLLAGPNGTGKTTLLRDLRRSKSRPSNQQPPSSEQGPLIPSGARYCPNPHPHQHPQSQGFHGRGVRADGVLSGERLAGTGFEGGRRKDGGGPEDAGDRGAAEAGHIDLERRGVPEGVPGDGIDPEGRGAAAGRADGAPGRGKPDRCAADAAGGRPEDGNGRPVLQPRPARRPAGGRPGVRPHPRRAFPRQRSVISSEDPSVISSEVEKSKTAVLRAAFPALETL